MKRKKKKIELSAEWRERHERTQQALLERLEYHRRRLDDRRSGHSRA